MRIPLKLSTAGLVAALALASLASADTQSDGTVNVQPGMWRWNHETHVVGIPIREENLECLIPEKAEITLSRLAYDLNEGCGVENVSATDDGYAFTLVCKGQYNGKAQATLAHTDTTLDIKADGSVRFVGIPAPFSWKGKATHAGECPAEELERQREKWQAEQAAAQQAAAR
jgi:hypothetical protein